MVGELTLSDLEKVKEFKTVKGVAVNECSGRWGHYIYILDENGKPVSKSGRRAHKYNKNYYVYMKGSKLNPLKLKKDKSLVEKIFDFCGGLSKEHQKKEFEYNTTDIVVIEIEKVINK